MNERPPLPAAQRNVEVWDCEVRGLYQANQPYYTSDQLREYALLAVKAERERCAVIAETPFTGEQDDITMQAKDRIAAAIRSLSDTPT